MNQLWQDYSNRHFGFSVQSLIWQSKTWRTACEELGWLRGYSHRSNRGYSYSTFSNESQLTFNALEAPAGHLPSTAIHIALQERTSQPFMGTLLRRFHISNV
ncbi:GUN4 domain-containing protein [Leptolyngbyaceae cyanobacterium UHCC 1019]